MLRPAAFIAFLLGCFAPGVAVAEEKPATQKSIVDSIAPFFAPFTTERAALAPDGKHVAFTLRKDSSVFVVILNLDRPEQRVTLEVGDDEVRAKSPNGRILTMAQTLGIRGAHFRTNEKISATVPLLAWCRPDRLIFTNDVGELIGADSNGQHAGKLVSPDDLRLRVDAETDLYSALGSNPYVRRAPIFCETLPDDPNHILIAAEGDVPVRPGNPPQYVVSVYQVDAQTGKLKPTHEKTFLPGTRVLYDKAGRPRFSFDAGVRRKTYVYLDGAGAFGKNQAVAAELAEVLAVSPENYFGERTLPLGFDYDPNVVYLASNTGRDTYGFYALNLQTQQRTEVTPKNLPFDAGDLEGSIATQHLVFDRYQKKLVGIRLMGVTPDTYWIDPELAKIQRDLNRAFPLRFTQIIEWDRARKRFLVQVSSCSDPGSFFIFFSGENRAAEVVRMLPKSVADKTSPTVPFEFDTPEGVHLTGYITEPISPKLNPPPLVVFCHDPLTGRALPFYQRDVQALASMGFVVVQLNYRGSIGFGRAHREALTAGFSKGMDRAPIDDMVAAIDWIAARQPVDQNRIALFGTGYGGSLALRALQTRPERFRCVITIDAPTDFHPWLQHAEVEQIFDSMIGRGADRAASEPPEMLRVQTPRDVYVVPLPPAVDFFAEVRKHIFGGKGPHLEPLSPLKSAGTLTKPVLLIQDPSNPHLPAGQGAELCKELNRRGVTAEYLEVSAEFTHRLPRASAQTFARIQEFVNLNLYDYDVKVGKPQVK